MNAFMGHWARGQEPWGKYSSLSVIGIVEILKVYIHEILEILDIEAMGSKFV